MKIAPVPQQLVWTAPFSPADVLMIQPGAGMGSGTFSSIAEALAFCDYWGHPVVNRDEALEAYAKQRGWPDRA